MILGLTGGLGTGKTTVAKIFARLGAGIIDADAVGHDLLRPGSVQYKKIISCFGRDVLRNSARLIDRRKLGKLVFSCDEALYKLNSIMHPAIIAAIKHRIKKDKHKIIVIDAPLLIETGLHDMADKLVVVSAKEETQLKRLLKKTSLSRKDLLRRINVQIRLRDKLRLADFIIDNDGSRAQLRKQVVAVWKQVS